MKPEILSASFRADAARARAWLAAHGDEPPPPPAAVLIRALARVIDQTLLAPQATPQAVSALCAGARAAGFAAVCVSPLHVPIAAQELSGSGVAVATVIGFPSGAHRTEIKTAEARRAVADGAAELDMVLPLGLLRAGLDDQVERDIAAVVAAAGGGIVKVILETALLDEAEKIRAVRACRAAGASFVKTSTGFGPGGATEADVALLRREAGDVMGVKASGGIRTAAAALAMVAAGADRIGTSSGHEILKAAGAL